MKNVISRTKRGYEGWRNVTVIGKKKSFILVYLVPTLIFFIVFVAYPCINALTMSFYKWSGTASARKFVGLANFRRLIGDEIVWKALGNNVFLLVFCTLFTFVLSLSFALMVAKAKNVYHRTLRIVYFIPYVMSIAVVSVLWTFIFNPSFGLINEFLTRVGLESWTRVWLGEASVIMGALTVPLVWMNVGFYMIIFVATILNIPEERYEAAKIDGAGKWQQFLKVTMPGMWQEIRTSLVFFIVTAFNYSFGLVYVMTKGGPNRSSELLTTYLYENAFVNSDYGYASAIGAVLFVLLAIVIFLVLKVTKARYQDE